MARINLYTTLSTIPDPTFIPGKRPLKKFYMQRGATATFSLDFFDKIYKWENINQVTFTFKQEKMVKLFEAIKYLDGGEWELNEYFSLTSDQSSLVLKLPPEITKEFSCTYGEDELVRFEIVVDLDVNTFNNKPDTDTMIEFEPCIDVVDTIIANCD